MGNTTISKINIREKPDQEYAKRMFFVFLFMFIPIASVYNAISFLTLKFISRVLFSSTDKLQNIDYQKFFFKLLIKGELYDIKLTIKSVSRLRNRRLS